MVRLIVKASYLDLNSLFPSLNKINCKAFTVYWTHPQFVNSFFQKLFSYLIYFFQISSLLFFFMYISSEYNNLREFFWIFFPFIHVSCFFHQTFYSLNKKNQLNMKNRTIRYSLGGAHKFLYLHSQERNPWISILEVRVLGGAFTGEALSHLGYLCRWFKTIQVRQYAVFFWILHSHTHTHTHTHTHAYTHKMRICITTQLHTH